MTLREVFEKKEFADKYDVMICFECGRCKAETVIRTIKYVSDIAKISGKITLKDYILWAGVDNLSTNLSERHAD